MPNDDASEVTTTSNAADSPDSSAASVVDALMTAWEAMSEHYLEGRRELLDAVVEQLSQLGFRDGANVVELGSGPGTLLTRLATALPSVYLVGVEIDPMLKRIHQLGASPHEIGRVDLVGADLAEPQWLDALPMAAGTVDVVIAVQVLHYFPPSRFAALLSEIRALLGDDGVLVHLDRVPRPSGPEPSAEPAPEQSAAADPWTRWWGEVAEVPFLADAARERDHQLRVRPLSSAEYHPDEPSLRALLAQAGLRTLLFERRVGESLLTIVGSNAAITG